MKGKLIVIEGTDCSGKETQSKKLIERLFSENIKTKYFSFPNYESPTGKIIGGPYLGKKNISEGWFEEGASEVDPYVSALFYAADRKYNIKLIKDYIDNGYNVILDRYFYSNMAHQGGKILDNEKRFEMYNFIENLEINLLKLPVPEIKIFLHVPYLLGTKLKENRLEEPDQHENNKEHLINAELSYLEIIKKYDFKTIECNKSNNIKTIEEINDEIYDYIKPFLI